METHFQFCGSCTQVVNNYSYYSNSKYNNKIIVILTIDSISKIF